MKKLTLKQSHDKGYDTGYKVGLENWRDQALDRMASERADAYRDGRRDGIDRAEFEARNKYKRTPFQKLASLIGYIVIAGIFAVGIVTMYALLFIEKPHSNVQIGSGVSQWQHYEPIETGNATYMCLGDGCETAE